MMNQYDGRNQYKEETYVDAYGNTISNLTLSQYMTRTFSWMFFGLLTTFSLAFAVAQTGLYIPLYNSGMIFVLTIAELIVVITLSSRINRMASGTATMLFFVYAMLNGLVFSVYFVMYQLSSLIGAFLVAALYFGALAVYGAVTKRDVSGWGPSLFAGLIALLIFSVISLFLGNVGSILLSAIGLVLFMCLTAYDTQKIKSLYYAYGGNGEMGAKASVFAALSLYLDFINIFLYVLRLMGRRRN